MNETALPIVTALAFNAKAMWTALGTINPGGQFAAGMNQYEYSASNPVNLLDALGLNPWDDPFDEVDETLGGIYAARVSAAMDFARFFETLAITTGQVAIESMICALVPGGVFLVGGWHAAHAAADMSQEGLTWSNGLEMAFGAAPFAGKLIRGFSKTLGEMRATRAVAAGGAATGQLHHAISMKIWKALERNPATRGKYSYRDPRFVTRAKDAGSHQGYQGWHRQLDDDVERWIDDFNPTPEQFEAELYRRYSAPEILERFPEGL